jgi:DSF synthase
MAFAQSILNHAGCHRFAEAANLQRISAFYEEERRVLWTFHHPHPRPCFSFELLKEVALVQRAAQKSGLPIDFWVTGSTVPGFFNAGGNLSFLASLIRANDRETLLAYARSCVDAIHNAMTGFGMNAVTIAQVEGTALGGGLEAALAHDFVLAQEDVKLGLPEMAFDLYPGMGAYPLTMRRSNRRVAEDLILSGESHSGLWFYERGIIDRTFVSGDAFTATRTLIDNLRPKLNAVRGLLAMRNRTSPVTRQELMEVTEQWVEFALMLAPDKLEYMERLGKLQEKRPIKPLQLVPSSLMPPPVEAPVLRHATV